MSHTPGPWQIKRTLEEERFTIWDNEHRLLAVAYNQDLDHKGPDGCVRAIAAVPDMEEWIECTIDHLKMLPNTELIIASGQKLLKRFNIVTIDIDDE